MNLWISNQQRTLSLRRLGAMLLLVAALATAGVGTASAFVFEPEPTDPVIIKPKPNNADKAYDCLNRAQAGHTFTVDRPAFSGSSVVQVRWNIKTPSDCKNLLYSLNGKSIPASGVKSTVNFTSTTYRLSASYARFGKQLSTATVPYVNIVTYSESVARVAARTAATRHIQLLLGKIKEPNKLRLSGWKIELHIIPSSLKLTDLPPYRDLDGNETDQDDDGNRRYDDLRGAGGVKITEKKVIRMAIGEEQLISGTNTPFNVQPMGYILAHEMGHTILGQIKFDSIKGRFVPSILHTLSSSQVAKVIQLHAQRQSRPLSDWLGLTTAQKKYLKGDPEEYFGDCVAAYFRYPIAFGSVTAARYRPEWLKANDRGMYDLLRQIFD